MEGTVASNKKLVGTLSSGGSMVGGVATVYGKDGKDGIDGKSAYEIALTNGFEGTETEWLESIRGKDGHTPVKGVDYFDGKDGKDGTMSFEELTEEQKESLRGEKGDPGNPGVYIGSGDMPEDCYVQIDPNGKALGFEEIEKLLRPARITTVDLPASAWTGADHLYSQVVTIDGITEYSKVDLLPSVEQLAVFYTKDVAFVTENEDGVVTVYAIGDKPLLDYTMQAQITEVAL